MGMNGVREDVQAGVLQTLFVTYGPVRELVV
jgi:hypothetical protein